ncbi:MAG: ABC transporter permease [Firmicutes bacterium]|nr:ABC transporter permease [Bacillota bacterium]
MRRTRLIESWPILIGQLMLLSLILIVTEYVVDNNIVGDLYLAAPSQVAAGFIGLLNRSHLFRHLEVTLFEFLLGFASSAALGVSLGLLVARVAVVEKFTKPYLSGLMAIPKVAIIPLLTIWLGIGFFSKAILVFMFSFFPILYNTISGVKQTPDNYLKVARVFGATRLQVITKVILPSAMPTIFAGFRVAAASGLVGALFGEMLASKEGLGNLLTKASQLYNTGQLFAVISVVTVLSVLIIQVLDLLEKSVFLRWKYY